MEGGPVALVVGSGKARQSLSDAAWQCAAVLHCLECLGGRRIDAEAECDGCAEKKDCGLHEAAFPETVLVHLDRNLRDLEGFFSNTTLAAHAGAPNVPANIAPACAVLVLVYLPSQNDQPPRSRG